MMSAHLKMMSAYLEMMTAQSAFKSATKRGRWGLAPNGDDECTHGDNGDNGDN